MTDAPVIQATAQRLLTDLLAQVQRREEALRRLECIVYGERVAPQVLSIGLSRASREHAHIAQLLAQRLEQIDLSPGIAGLRLIARQTSRWHGGQGDLFEPREPGDEEAFGYLIDRLAQRLGYAAVLRPRLVEDHQPEMAFRYVSVAEAGCEVEVSRDTDERPVGSLPRPVRLLPRPVPIRVIALVPDGPPTWLAYHGREYVVAHASGPERLETAWWRGPDVRRDYFRVTTETGEQFWVFRAKDEGRWHLHGIFA